MRMASCFVETDVAPDPELCRRRLAIFGVGAQGSRPDTSRLEPVQTERFQTSVQERLGILGDEWLLVSRDAGNQRHDDTFNKCADEQMGVTVGPYGSPDNMRNRRRDPAVG
jgi:hypothetical protein